jgi:hypothetical protein
MSNQPSNFQDPKPFNTVSLINQRNFIKELIDAGEAAKAYKHMATLTCEFTLCNKNPEMITIKANLKKNFRTPYLPAVEIIDYWDTINNYMNDTYCKGFHAPMDNDFFKELEDKDDDKET